MVPKLVMVGDPHQLGPVVLEPGNALQQDLFSRITQINRIPMLEEQHRMNAGLTALIAPTYGPSYRPHASVASTNLVALGLPDHPLSSASCVWVDTAGYDAEEQRDPVSRSVHNPVEVKLVVHAVEQLLLLGVELSGIAIIAPYSAQVNALREAIPGARVDTVNAFSRARVKRCLVHLCPLQSRCRAGICALLAAASGVLIKSSAPVDRG